jgi:hypothetical protein
MPRDGSKVAHTKTCSEEHMPSRILVYGMGCDTEVYRMMKRNEETSFTFTH